jgi:amino acid transporter
MASSFSTGKPARSGSKAMKGRIEFLFYITVGVGMALATTTFAMISEFFSLATPFWILVGVVLAGVFCITISFSIGELASMYPSAPGIRTYLKVAFGGRISLVLVYLYLIFVVLIAGLESFVFSQVMRAVSPSIEPVATVLMLLVVVMAVNLTGFVLPRGMQMLTTILAVLLIAISGIYGLMNAKTDLGSLLSIGDAQRQISILPALVGMGIFLYTGFEWVTPLGLRPKAYERKIPFSMPAAVLTLLLTYSLFILGGGSQLTTQEITATPIPQVGYFSALYGPLGLFVALSLSIFAIFSTFNAGLMGGSQLILVLSREGNLPGWCGAMSARTGSPFGAILLLGSISTASAITVLIFRLENSFALIGAAIMCFVYTAFMLSAIKLRRIKPNTPRPFRSPVVLIAQWMIVAFLPIIGVQTLLSQPGIRFQALGGAVLSMVLAWSLSLLSPSAKKASVKTVQRADRAASG